MEYKISENLVKIINNFPENEKENFVNLVREIFDNYKQPYDKAIEHKIDKVKILKHFYKIFDEFSKSDTLKNVSCKRGCSFCCNINVDMCKVEADLIMEEIGGLSSEQTNILKNQKGLDILQRAQSEYSACAFLKDGECSIYNIRPIHCRKYYVINPPEECNAKKNPNGINQIQCSIDMEILSDFIYNVFGESKSMCDMLINN